MSLVNDLLIEAERRRGGSRQARDIRLDDLVPNRQAARSRRAPSPAGKLRLMLGLVGIVQPG